MSLESVANLTPKRMILDYFASCGSNFGVCKIISLFRKFVSDHVAQLTAAKESEVKSFQLENFQTFQKAR